MNNLDTIAIQCPIDKHKIKNTYITKENIHVYNKTIIKWNENMPASPVRIHLMITVVHIEIYNVPFDLPYWVHLFDIHAPWFFRICVCDDQDRKPKNKNSFKFEDCNICLHSIYNLHVYHCSIYRTISFSSITIGTYNDSLF